MNCTGRRCPMQVGSVDPETCSRVGDCMYATPPQTNADCIRAMSDEKLAEWICSRITNCEDRCPGKELCGFGRGHANGLIDWIKQEAET